MMVSAPLSGPQGIQPPAAALGCPWQMHLAGCWAAAAALFVKQRHRAVLGPASSLQPVSNALCGPGRRRFQVCRHWACSMRAPGSATVGGPRRCQVSSFRSAEQRQVSSLRPVTVSSRFQVCRQPVTCGPEAGFRSAASQSPACRPWPFYVCRGRGQSGPCRLGACFKFPTESLGHWHWRVTEALSRLQVCLVWSGRFTFAASQAREDWGPGILRF